MAQDYDLFKYGQVLWKGFNQEERGEGAIQFDEDIKEAYELGFNRPNCNLDIKIAVVALNGDFVSYCGMWQDPAISASLIEPVALDPAYRRLGFAELLSWKACGGPAYSVPPKHLSAPPIVVSREPPAFRHGEMSVPDITLSFHCNLNTLKERCKP
ncbi:MAG: hypothetical protein FWE76_05820 [Symbiobacteriaceae bacterium]|nr:hypothetical protein [Symbiobacteriaceae bacterium]